MAHDLALPTLGTHPLTRTALAAVLMGERRQQQRAGIEACGHFLRTATCKFGTACRQSHEQTLAVWVLPLHCHPLSQEQSQQRRKRNFCDECNGKVKNHPYRCTVGCDYDCCARCVQACGNVVPVDAEAALAAVEAGVSLTPPDQEQKPGDGALMKEASAAHPDAVTALGAEERVGRLVAELELIASVYPEATVRPDGSGFETWLGDDNNVSLRMHVRVTFPPDYPGGRGAPEVTVLPSAGWSRSSASRAAVALAEIGTDLCEATCGDECALQLLMAAEDMLREYQHHHQPAQPEPEPEPELEPGNDVACLPCAAGPGTIPELQLLMLRFDHIKAKPARKCIAETAQRLQLGGVLRPGKPGIVCVEGAPGAVKEFESIIRLQLSTCTRNAGCWGARAAA